MTEIETAARARKTLKLLGNPADPLPPSGIDRAVVDEMIEAAGWAPFHRPAQAAREGGSSVCEPWRVAILDAPACRALLARLPEFSKPAGKVADMLAVADTLLMVTWMPEPATGEGWEASDFNMEHIAAGAAFIQTFLLAATARGIGNYWSSGGVLGSRHGFDLLGIDPGDVLLGAVFLFPDPPEGTDPKPGKLRTKRSVPAAWSRWISPDA